MWVKIYLKISYEEQTNLLMFSGFFNDRKNETLVNSFSNFPELLTDLLPCNLPYVTCSRWSELFYPFTLLLSVSWIWCVVCLLISWSYLVASCIIFVASVMAFCLLSDSNEKVSMTASACFQDLLRRGCSWRLDKEEEGHCGTSSSAWCGRHQQACQVAESGGWMNELRCKMKDPSKSLLRYSVTQHLCQQEILVRFQFGFIMLHGSNLLRSSGLSELFNVRPESSNQISVRDSLSLSHQIVFGVEKLSTSDPASLSHGRLPDPGLILCYQMSTVVQEVTQRAGLDIPSRSLVQDFTLSWELSNSCMAFSSELFGMLANEVALGR